MMSLQRLSLVADMEKNGAKFRSSRGRLQAGYEMLKRTHCLLSEAEELRQRLGMAEEELIQQRPSSSSFI